MSRLKGSEIRFKLTKREMLRFEAFLEVRGAKKGPFVRQLVLRALEEAERGAASVQGQALAQAIRERSA